MQKTLVLFISLVLVSRLGSIKKGLFVYNFNESNLRPAPQLYFRLWWVLTWSSWSKVTGEQLNEAIIARHKIILILNLKYSFFQARPAGESQDFTEDEMYEAAREAFNKVSCVLLIRSYLLPLLNRQDYIHCLTKRIFHGPFLAFSLRRQNLKLFRQACAEQFFYYFGRIFT